MASGMTACDSSYSKMDDRPDALLTKQKAHWSRHNTNQHLEERLSINDVTQFYGKRNPFPPFVTFRHAALDPLKYDVTNFQPPLAVCSVAYNSTGVSNTTQIFCTIHTFMGHSRLCRGPWIGTSAAVGLHHYPSLSRQLKRSIEAVLYCGVLYSVDY